MSDDTNGTTTKTTDNQEYQRGKGQPVWRDHSALETHGYGDGRPQDHQYGGDEFGEHAAAGVVGHWS